MSSARSVASEGPRHSKSAWAFQMIALGISRRNLQRILMAGAVLTVIALDTHAQVDENSRWYYERCEPFLQEISKEIAPKLSPSERQELRAAKIKCELDPGFGAAASRDANGRAVITFTSGTIATLDPVATAMALGGAYNKSLCGSFYIEAIGKVIRRNMQHMLDKTPLEPGLSPFDFAARTRQYCPAISESTFRGNERAADTRELLINGGLRFILAHELSHIILKHVDSQPESLRDSRTRERECDKFALRVVQQAGGTPMEVMAAIALLATVDDFAMRTDRTSTHPSGGARFLSVAEATRSLMANDADIMQWMKNDPDRAERWRNALMAFEAMAAERDE